MISISRAGRAAVLALLLALSLTATVAAQSASPFNERDDQYRLLGLKRSKQAFELARDQHARKQQLYNEGILSESELLTARQQLSEAEVNFQQSLLAVLFEQQYVAVLEAVKYSSESGHKRIRLRLENTSGGGAEFRHLLALDAELLRSLRPEIVHDVYVSLANDEGAVISQPYEAKIEELHYGRPADINFELLQDVDTVTVNLAYGHSAQRTVKVFLQKDSTVDKLAVQSEQFAQEVELGSSASFDLTLELFSGTSDTFKLALVNLPAQINRYFLDPQSQARLSQFKFSESTRSREAALRISLPDRASEQVAMDEAIAFYVLAIPRQQTELIRQLEKKHMTAEQIAELGMGYVRLELIPRGVGELLVRVPQLYFSIEHDEAAVVTLELVNDGTRRLDNVEVSAELPLMWTKTIEPAIIPTLEVGEERRVTLRFQPPADIAPGKYEVRVLSSSFADDRPIEAADKTVSVDIQPTTQFLLPAALSSLLIGLICCVIYAGVRLSRR